MNTATPAGRPPLDAVPSQPVPRQRPPRRRRWPWLVGAPLAALLACELAGWRFLRAPIEAQASRLAGVEVRLDAPLRLHLLGPPRVSLGGLHVDAAPGSEAPFLVESRGLEVRGSWSGAFATMRDGLVRLQRVRAESIEAHLLRPRDGVPSWQLRAPPDRPAADEPLPPMPRIDEVVLRDARLHLHDEILRLQLDARIAFDERRAREPVPVPARPSASPVQAAGTLPEPPREAAFRVEAEGRYRDAAVTAALSAEALLPVIAEPGTAPLDVIARVRLGETEARFQGRLADLLGAMDLDGRIGVGGPTLADAGDPLGVTLPSTPAYELIGTLRRDRTVWQADIDKAEIGRSRLRGAFRFDPTGERPRLDGRLEGERLVISDLAASVGAAADEKPAPAAVRADSPQAPDGKVLPDQPFDLPALRDMDADVSIALDALETGTPALESFEPLRGRIRLDDGVLRIDELHAATAGGTVTGRTMLDGTATPPRWQADLQWRNVDLAGWASGLRQDDATVDARSSDAALARERRAARRGGEDEDVRAYATGELRGRLALEGRGQSAAEILGSLDGRVQARLVDGTLSHLIVEGFGLDLAQAVGVFFGGDRSLPLRCAVFNIDAKDGVLRPSAAMLDTRDSRILIDGTVDMKREQLDLRAVTRPKDWSVFSVRSPLHVTGSFANPSPSVETAPLVGRALAAAVLAALNPVAGVLPFIDTGDERDDGGAGCVPPASLAAEGTSAGQASDPAAPAPRGEAEPSGTGRDGGAAGRSDRLPDAAPPSGPPGARPFPGG